MSDSIFPQGPVQSVPQGVSNPANHGPEDYADVANGLAKVIANALMKTENMLPVRVVQYDRTNNVASVQPLVNIVMTGGSFPRGAIGPIPVFAAGAGNFVISYPIKAGDLGWIMANDRDITAFLESLSQGDPATFRNHSFNDAVLFPDAIRNFSTSGEDGNMVIQSLDGTIKISLGQSQLRLAHPTKIFLDAPDVEFQKNAHGPGTATFDTDVVFDGISGKNHLHDGQGNLVANSTPVTGQTSKPHN